MTPDEAKAIAERIYAEHIDRGGMREAIAAALLEAAGQWNADMDAARKVGTRILVYSSERCENCPENTVGMSVADWDGSKWMLGRTISGRDLYLHHDPTHWRHLPAPPETEVNAMAE